MALKRVNLVVVRGDYRAISLDFYCSFHEAIKYGRRPD